MNNKETYIKSLNGHSGCKINLIKNTESEEIYVRKISSSANYNIRLKKQFIKQQNFEPSNIVRSPLIYNWGFNNGLFYFDMEYIQCKTLAEYVSSITIVEIVDYIHYLFKHLYLSKNYNNCNANKIFKQKILSLEIQLKQYENLKEAFCVLKNFDWSYVEKSPCHGDLTLENILITKDKKIFLIDFLDSFFNSWMIDIAKLLQDLELKWSFRKNQLSANAELKLLIGKETLKEEILKINNGNRILDTIYHILLLNVIRIYPYTKDTETFKFLNNSIEYLLKVQKENIGVLK